MPVRQLFFDHAALGGDNRVRLLPVSTDCYDPARPINEVSNLEFGDGVDVPDPAHRLEGTGKRLRHVKISTSQDVLSPEVRALLEAAARLRGL